MLSQTLDWITAHPFVIGLVLVVSLALALIYGAVIYVAIGRMSSDYFIRDETSSSTWRQRYPLLGEDALVLKNVIGVVRVLMCIALLFLPGQGVLTLLIGISLLDFPGKRKLEKKIVRTPPVHKTMDAIRRRAGQPPLVLPK